MSHAQRSLVGAAVLLVAALLSMRTLTLETLTACVLPNTAPAALDRGSFHLEASSGGLYSIALAEYCFQSALRRDPYLLYVHHQLARVAFLEGDFRNALELIDREVHVAGDRVSPSSFYIRALIRGFAGDYRGSEEDYRQYLIHDPTNWAAVNDLAWVLLKDGKYDETILAIDPVLAYWPENPWLLNSKAIALYELGQYEESLKAAMLAHEHLDQVTEEKWLQSYPGNDPRVAAMGVATFRSAVLENMHRITLAYETEYKSMQ